MWLYEILTPVRSVAATSRFHETFKAFKRANANLDQTLYDFIEFRLSHQPSESFGAKDRPFTRELRGFWHYHMVHGRVILVYQVTPTDLRLSILTDHSYSSKQGEANLVAYLRSPSLSYQAVPFGKAAATLSRPQIDEITNLFFDFAAEDRSLLTHIIATDDLSQLLDFIRMVIHTSWSDAEKDRATLAAYGGIEGLKQAVQRVLQQTAVRI